MSLCNHGVVRSDVWLGSFTTNIFRNLGCRNRVYLEVAGEGPGRLLAHFCGQ